jgi:serine/threonine protein kinase
MSNPTDPRITRARPDAIGAPDPSAVGSNTVPTGGRFGPVADQPFSAPDRSGEVGRLGRYRVVKKLGEGGMGAVYLALDESLGRRIALKVMLPKFAAAPTARERFLREARTCAGVKSEHVVTLFDVDEVGGVPFIAMEYLQGHPLDQYLEQSAGRLTVSQVLRVGREAASGLAAAHSVGLVHRDIKPANLWLESPKGRIKILDFGLAKPVVSEGTGDADLTDTGAVLGTPAYMSPEQARGRPVDHRTDLFSLGAVLFRLITGQRPFSGPDAMAILTSLAVDTPPSVRALNPDAPAELDHLIHRMLAKDPAFRPSSAEEVAAELARIERALAAGDPVPVSTAAAEPEVYAAITVAPGVNPFEGLSELSESFDATGESSGDVRSAAERGKRGGWGGWAAAAVALVVIAALGVGAWLKLKPRTEEKSDDEAAKVPDTKPSGAPKRVEQPPKGKGVAPSSAVPAFFTGRDLTGWTPRSDRKGKWSVENGEIVCRVPDNETAPTTLAWNGTARDFLLTFEARSTPYPGADKFGTYLHFRQVDLKSVVFRIGSPGPVGEFTDGSSNPWRAFPGAPELPEATTAPAGADGYHTFTLMVTGRRVTATANSVPVLEGFELPDTVLQAGTITWQADHSVSELRVRNIRFVELTPPDPTFFNGKNLNGWLGDEKSWRVENGELVCTRPAGHKDLLRLTAVRPRGDFFFSFRVKYAGTAGSLDCRGDAETGRYARVQLGGADEFGGLAARGKTFFQRPSKASQAWVKPNDYNDVAVLAVGKRVTVFVNGATTADAEMDVPGAGKLEWLTFENCTEMRVRDMVFRDLSS